MNNFTKKDFLLSIIFGSVILGFSLVRTIGFPLHYISSIALIALFLFTSYPPRSSFVNKYYFIFCAYASISGLAISKNLNIFYQHVFIIIQLSVLMYAFYNLSIKLYSVRFIAYAIIGVSLFLIFGPYVGVSLGSSTEYMGRYTGLMSNPNSLGYFINLLYLSTLYLHYRRKTKGLKASNFILLLVIFISIFFLAFTGSRKSLVSFTLITIVFSYINFEFQFRYVIIALLLILALSLKSDLLLNFFEDSPLAKRLESNEFETASEDRLNLISEALTVFLKYPLTGAGMANFSFHSGLGMFRYSHNYYSEILANNGLIGFLILFIIYFKTIRLFRAFYSDEILHSEIVFGILFLTLAFSWSFGYSLHDSVDHWLILTGIIGVIHGYKRNNLKWGE